MQTKLQVDKVSEEHRYDFVNIDHRVVLFVVTESFNEFEPVMINAGIIYQSPINFVLTRFFITWMKSKLEQLLNKCFITLSFFDFLMSLY